MGHSLLSENREYERGVTASINASVQPILEKYLRKLENELSIANYKNELLVMNGNGGTISSKMVVNEAAKTVMSGPASGVIAAAHTGKSSGINNLPDDRIYGGPNQLLGLNFASAGDSNQDGYADFLITRRSTPTNTNIDLYLGSETGFVNNGLMVSSGDLTLGQSISNFGDSNNDGLSEFLYSSNMVNENQTYLSIIEHITRTLWDITEYPIHGEISGGIIQSSADGSPTIICKLSDNSKTNIVKINLGKGSQANTWISQNITNPATNSWNTVNFELTSSGEPIIFLSLIHI